MRQDPKTVALFKNPRLLTFGTNIRASKNTKTVRSYLEDYRDQHMILNDVTPVDLPHVCAVYTMAHRKDLYIALYCM